MFIENDLGMLCTCAYIIAKNLFLQILFLNQRFVDFLTYKIKYFFKQWKEEVTQNISNSILLSVHGVTPPGEEITVQLKNVLQRRLNLRTLEEIQNALLKNSQIRLEGSDIKVFYFLNKYY